MKRAVIVKTHAPHLTRMGLGDVVAKVAQPIAKAIDAATSVLPKPMQTNVKECGGCAKRREALNRIAPDVSNLRL